MGGIIVQLIELTGYEEINIQCHDDPDPDTIASGYALYCYFRRLGKKVRLLYSGRRAVTKPNIVMLIEALKIPIEYVMNIEKIEGLLITVDCQYGAGNVTRIEADEIAIIDHHIQEVTSRALQEIRSEFTSNCTLIWHMLSKAGWDVNENISASTALYYGLFTDSGGFSEMRHALDKDMRDSLTYDKALIKKLKNSIITLKELEIAGLALIRSSYNEANKCVMVKAQECDPNILGLISDFALQVDCVNVVIVYSETSQEIKYSVRSCVREIMANELAVFLSWQIGNGGGRRDKAAGLISRNKYNLSYQHLNADEYFLRRLTEYYQSFDIVKCQELKLPDANMHYYRKLRHPVGFVNLAQIAKEYTTITIRSQQEDLEVNIGEKQYLTIEDEGQIQLMSEEDFVQHYDKGNEPFSLTLNYFPKMWTKESGRIIHLQKYAKYCFAKGEDRVWARPLEKAVKLFDDGEEEGYTIGQIGDYLVMNEKENGKAYIIGQGLFKAHYELV